MTSVRLVTAASCQQCTVDLTPTGRRTADAMAEAHTKTAGHATVVRSWPAGTQPGQPTTTRTDVHRLKGATK